MFNNYNPYYNYMQPQIPRVDTPFTQPPTQQPVQPMYKQNIRWKCELFSIIRW